VVDANPARVVEKGGAAVPGQAREGYYIVKKGDNLYRIALNHGVSTHDLVTWNSLSDETKIEIGQELRVRAPDNPDVEIKPIAAPAAITVVSDGATASPGPVAGGSGVAVVREPRGGKIPYSDTALAQVRAMDAGASAARPVEPVAPAPAPAMTPAPAPAPAPAPTPAPAASDHVDWTWPIAGKVVRGFGKNNGGEISRGIDIAGRMGEPIQAAAAGKVTFVGSLRGYGDFLVLRHNNDFISVYAHTSKILVKKDQSVAKGQKIAEVGSSDADQPKLHFEIRQQSKPVDPLKLLPVR
jgi:lipoprotein NlpD